MRILLVAIGTRGDVQPVLAVARGLKDAGHDATIVAGRNFAAWVQSHGFNFASAVDIEALMQSDAGLRWVERGLDPRIQLRQMRRLLEEHWRAITDPILHVVADADLVLGGFTSEPFLETICARFGKPLISLYLQPARPTKSGAATLQPIFATRTNLLNRWAGRFAQRLLWGMAAPPVNALRRELGMGPHSFSRYARAVERIPVIHGFSPYVVPHASDWPRHIHTTGYWFLDNGRDWQPPSPLRAFLEAGEPPLYVGFGSMPSSAPQKVAGLVNEALHLTGQRAVFAKGWSGGGGRDSDHRLFVLESAPHAWLFSRVSAVIHHGGAGTTAEGLRAGKPALIVPHMADQPYWGRRVSELRVGPRPVPRPRLTARTLAAAITELITDQTLQENACALGERIRAEDGVGKAVTLVQRLSTDY